MQSQRPVATSGTGDLPNVRRQDKIMPEEEAWRWLSEGLCGRIGTVGPDGWPYVTPLLYVLLDSRIYVHNTKAVGHLRRNVNHEPRVCFEVDVPGEVFGYGPDLCSTSVQYRSVVAFGRIAVIEDRSLKQRFCEELIRKYGPHDSGRADGVFPRLDHISVYEMTIERLTGKETRLPTAARSPAGEESAS